MTLYTILVNVVLPVFLVSTLVAALFAYWFALGATMGSIMETRSHNGKKDDGYHSAHALLTHSST